MFERKNLPTGELGVMIDPPAGPFPAAAHAPRDTKGINHATGHVYLLHLRITAIRHLDLCDPIHKRKEHHVTVIKRAGCNDIAPTSSGRVIPRITWTRSRQRRIPGVSHL